MNTYYTILGVNQNSSLDEIKKAFRKKAKELHPDVNKSPDANAEFIKINEAYDYIINQKLGLKYNNKRQNYQSAKRYPTAEEWQRYEQAKAHERANYYSRKKYQEFHSSKYYKESQAIKEFGNLFVMVVLFIYIVVFPALLNIFFGASGLAIGLIMAFISIPGWGPIVLGGRLPNIKVAMEGLSIAIPNKIEIWAFFSISLFLTVFFTIGFKTFISIRDLALFFSLFAVFSYFFSPKKKNILFALGVYAPVVMSLLLLLNYYISFNQVTESIRYHPTYERTRKGTMRTSEVELENDAYDDYPSVRFFWDYSSISGSKVSYTIRTGILGYKIYTDREFINE